MQTHLAVPQRPNHRARGSRRLPDRTTESRVRPVALCRHANRAPVCEFSNRRGRRRRKILMERPLIPVRGALIIPEIRPEWRNWQTRQVEGLVPVMGVQVQVLSPALVTVKGFTSRRREPFFVAIAW